MKPMHRRRALLRGIVLLFAFSAASCGERLPKSLPMEPNPVFTAGIGWIVVSRAYVRVKAEPSSEAPDLGHLRGGDVLAVRGRERNPREGGSWYRIALGDGEGWMDGAQAVFFESRDAAERAAGQYR